MQRAEAGTKQSYCNSETAAYKLFCFNIADSPVEMTEPDAQQQQNCVDYVIGIHF